MAAMMTDRVRKKATFHSLEPKVCTCNTYAVPCGTAVLPSKKWKLRSEYVHRQTRSIRGFQEITKRERKWLEESGPEESKEPVL